MTKDENDTCDHYKCDICGDHRFNVKMPDGNTLVLCKTCFEIISKFVSMKTKKDIDNGN